MPSTPEDMSGIVSELGFGDVLYTFADIARLHDINPDEFTKYFGTNPFLLSVPIGEEHETSQRILEFTNNYFRAATPNFVIQPTTTTPNYKNIDDILNRLVGPISQCGNDVKIALLDTGADNSRMFRAASLHSQQINTHDPHSHPSSANDPDDHGTLTAYIINYIAPYASLYSVRVMDSQFGTLMGLISGMFLAEKQFKPDIFNLSLTVDLNNSCQNCGHIFIPPGYKHQIKMFIEAINNRSDGDIPLIVASAGNNLLEPGIPASFNDVVGVGSYDENSPDSRAYYSQYSNVGSGIFFLAPGGDNNSHDCLGTNNNFAGRSNYLYGTSFSTAFVTGIAATYACSQCGGTNGQGKRPPCISKFLKQELATKADINIKGYSKKTHGNGLVKS